MPWPCRCHEVVAGVGVHPGPVALRPGRGSGGGVQRCHRRSLISSEVPCGILLSLWSAVCGPQVAAGRTTGWAPRCGTTAEVAGCTGLLCTPHSQGMPWAVPEHIDMEAMCRARLVAQVHAITTCAQVDCEVEVSEGRCRRDHSGARSPPQQDIGFDYRILHVHLGTDTVGYAPNLRQRTWLPFSCRAHRGSKRSGRLQAGSRVEPAAGRWGGGKH